VAGPWRWSTARGPRAHPPVSSSTCLGLGRPRARAASCRTRRGGRAVMTREGRPAAPDAAHAQGRRGRSMAAAGQRRWPQGPPGLPGLPHEAGAMTASVPQRVWPGASPWTARAGPSRAGTKPRRLGRWCGAEGPWGGGPEGRPSLQEGRTGSPPARHGQETPEVFPPLLGAGALEPVGDVPRPSRLPRPAGRAPRGVCRVALLEAGSRPGAGPDRSHAPGCRAQGWPSGRRPCGQTGPPAPGSPVAPAGVWRSTATARGWGGVAGPRRGRPGARVACRPRLAQPPPGRRRGKPRGGTGRRRRRRPAPASRVRGRRRGPRGEACERKVPWPCASAPRRGVALATRGGERAQEGRTWGGAARGAWAETPPSWSRRSARRRGQRVGAARSRPRPVPGQGPWPSRHARRETRLAPARLRLPPVHARCPPRRLRRSDAVPI
jgi:hypothetical protein